MSSKVCNTSIGLVLILISAFCHASHTQYMVVNIEQQKSGYAYSSRHAAGDLVETTEFVKLTVNRFGFMMEVTEKTIYTETADGEPVGFVTEQNFSGSAPQITTGIIRGNKIFVSRSGEPEVEFDYPQSTLMPEGIRQKVLAEGISEGKKFKLSTFDTTLLRALPTKVEVIGRENLDILGRIMPLYKVVTTTTIPGIGDITLRSFVDDDYVPYKSSTWLMGMTIEMLTCDKQVALSEYSPSDIFSKLLLKSPVSIPAEALKEPIIYTLKTLPDTKGLDIPSDYSQEVRKDGEKFVVIVSPIDEVEGCPLPPSYADSDKIRAYLDANGYIQSDEPEMIELAEKAAGKATDTLTAVRNIEEFVHNYISAKDLSVGYSTALEVLTSRQGDCTEHAVLTAALCRAMGIAAKVVCGIVYAEQFAGGGDVFGGHAWVEAYIGGKWVALDATIGRNGFGSGHIKLAAGDGRPESFFSIINLLGSFEIADVKFLKTGDKKP